MDNLRLPKQDSSTGRGLKSGFYAAVGALVTFSVGLWVVVQGVPGCSEAVLGYARDHFIELALAIGTAVGVQAGTLSYIVNFFRKGVKNY